MIAIRASRNSTAPIGNFQLKIYNFQNMKTDKTEMLPGDREDLLKELKARFEENMGRHSGIDWADVQAKLDASPEKLASLSKMEGSGGEPDVVGFDKKTGEFLFYDCSPESPKGRRSLC